MIMKNTSNISTVHSSERQNWLYLLLLLIPLFLLGIQDAVEDSSILMKYLDEAIGLLFVPALLLRWYQKKVGCHVTKQLLLFLILLAVFWMFGWAGVALHQYQPMSNALKDSYVALKFFLVIGASFLIFQELPDFRWTEQWLWKIANVITVVLTVLCVLDLIFGLFYTETRYGMPAIKLFYNSYTALVAVCCLLCAIYLRLYEYYQKKTLIPLAMLFFIMLNTRRIKALGAMVCVFVVYMYAFRRHKKISKKILIPAVVCLGIAVISMVWQLFYYYYQLGDESARLILTIAAPYITKDYFPLGTGWATYGSAFSAVPYSPIYMQYGMNVVWGISPSYHQFISDTFWPMLLVQCGVFGFIAYLGVLALFVRAVFRLRKRNASIFAAGMVPVLYLLLASSSESAFVNPLAVPFALWIGFLFAADYRNRQELSK